jgi:hypothetical protein
MCHAIRVARRDLLLVDALALLLAALVLVGVDAIASTHNLAFMIASLEWR